MEYASKSVGTAGLSLGIIGTSLGALAGAGGLAGLLGIHPNGGDPNDRPVTRYEMGLIGENISLKSQQYTDMRAAGIQAELSQQAVWNATQEGILRGQTQQLAQLYSLTQMVIPAGNVMPTPPVAVVASDVTVTERVKI